MRHSLTCSCGGQASCEDSCAVCESVGGLASSLHASRPPVGFWSHARNGFVGHGHGLPSCSLCVVLWELSRHCCFPQKLHRLFALLCSTPAMRVTLADGSLTQHTASAMHQHNHEVRHSLHHCTTTGHAHKCTADYLTAPVQVLYMM